MKSLCIDKYIQKYVFNKNEKLQSFIDFINNYCSQLEQNILLKKDTLALKLLHEYLYIVDTTYKSIGLMKMVSSNPYGLELLSADKKIENIISSFFKNEKIFERLSILDVSINILKKFKINQNSDIESIVNNIKHIENEIQKILCDNASMTTTSNMKQSITNIPNKIILNRQNYYYLQRKVDNALERKKIEDFYYKKSEKSLNLFAQLLIERHKYAILSGSTSYFYLIKKKSNGESDDIKLLINDLILKIDKRSRKEIDRIHRELHKNGFSKKVDINDIVHYYEKFSPKILFEPTYVLCVIFMLIKKYFGISFDIVDGTNNITWNPTVRTYKVSLDDKLLGLCYIDLIKYDGKSINSPNCMHLCHQYTTFSGKINPTKIAVIGNYSNVSANCMSFSDVLYLFREFGYAIQLLSYKAPNGIIFTNDEFNVLMPQIMEYIAWEKSTIELLCKPTNMQHMVDSIIFMRHTDFANSIKLRCVNAMFDHVTHNSPDFIKILKTSSSIEQTSTLLALYKKIYGDIMFSQQDILNLNISGINPTLIQQEINGSESVLYCNILSEILSFSIFQLVKQGHGKSFVTSVLHTDQSKMRKLLYSFISKMSEDSYDIYLHELVGHNEIDTELNKKTIDTNALILDTSANNFNEYSDDEDIENITKIVKTNQTRIK